MTWMTQKMVMKAEEPVVRYGHMCGRSVWAPFINVSLRPKHNSCSVALKQPHPNMPKLNRAKRTTPLL